MVTTESCPEYSLVAPDESMTLESMTPESMTPDSITSEPPTITDPITTDSITPNPLVTDPLVTDPASSVESQPQEQIIAEQCTPWRDAAMLVNASTMAIVTFVFVLLTLVPSYTHDGKISTSDLRYVQGACTVWGLMMAFSSLRILEALVRPEVVDRVRWHVCVEVAVNIAMVGLVVWVRSLVKLVGLGAGCGTICPACANSTTEG
jgi:hypothetical protein